MTTSYLSTPLKEIGDTHLLSLITDLEQVTGVRRELNYDLPFGMYLHDCLRPNGSDYPPIIINPRMLNKAAELLVLKNKINKILDTELYNLCKEIAKSREIHIENVHTKSVYVFLNECYKDQPKKRRGKRPKENRLWP